MSVLSHHDIVVTFLSLGTLLAVASLLSEVARKINQPSVLGELAAGILLGPTVLGSVAPNVTDYLFPKTGNVPLILGGFNTVAIVLFLLVAGMEVNLSTIWRQGKAAATVSLGGMIVPFILGFAAAWAAPSALGRHPDADHILFALFFATALSISALPVIAKTLMDLNIYRSDLGMVVIAAAICDDLAGWIIFAIILGLLSGKASNGLEIRDTIVLTLGFAVGMLTIGRWLCHRFLPWIQAHSSWPRGILAFALCLAFFGAACTEWFGIHAIFGSFLVGMAIGDSSHLREHTRTVIGQFVSFIFAPLFFASLGLRVNFAVHFDLRLVLLVLVIACAGKLLGCGVGARLGGMAGRQALALAFAMNARGAMEMILGLLALQHGLIQEPMFVALVLMALITSMISGPIMQRLLRLRRPRRLRDYIAPAAFVKSLQSRDRFSVIRELSAALSAAAGLDSAAVEAAVTAREEVGSTGLGDGMAVPHARLTGLPAPLIAIGLAKGGVDFDAPDGKPAQIVFLILTPTDDDGAQVEILADVARTFRAADVRRKTLQVANYTELLALLRTGVV